MKKSGTIFIPGLESFMNQNLVTRPNPIFLEIEKWAESESIPILSPVSGAILSQLVSFLRPKSILELGMGAGYSLFWMLNSILESDDLHDKENSPNLDPSINSLKSINIFTVDRNPEFVQKVEKLWKSSDYKIIENIHFHCGWILDDIKAGLISLDGWDLIFIDCDKILYPEILKLFLDRKTNSSNQKVHLVFDNVLWHGRILDRNSTKPSDIAILEFLTMIQEANLKFTLIPSGDGLLYMEV